MVVNLVIKEDFVIMEDANIMELFVETNNIQSYHILSKRPGCESRTRACRGNM